MILFQAFRITGATSSIVYDEGLKSTEAEPKRLHSVAVQMNSYGGSGDNDFQLYHERAKLMEIPETMLPQCDATDTTGDNHNGPWMELPVELDIPIGETVKAAIKCGANAVNVRGVYKYEITGK